ncbi:MAG: HDOD domain-containing protein [Gammaproteobacteria bacterium]|nr:MAG: HDOD domain-containing protein [Gammaproteobacteria bacterium]
MEQATAKKSDNQDFPTLPYIAHEILLAVNDPNSHVTGIAKIINNEPSLTARIIATANSAFFTGQRTVYSIDDAIVRLGLQRVRIMAASMLLADSFDLSKCPEFKTDLYWKTAIQTSTASGKIADLSKQYSADIASLAGLLHNIGSLLLAHTFPEQMTEVIIQYEKLNRENSLIIFLEQKIIGLDHNAAGKTLLTEWQLPEEVIEVAANINNPNYNGEYQNLIELIRFSNTWAESEFSTLPKLPLPEGIDMFKIDRIGQQCIKESENIEALASLLAREN